MKRLISLDIFKFYGTHQIDLENFSDDIWSNKVRIIILLDIHHSYNYNYYRFLYFLVISLFSVSKLKRFIP